MNMTIETIEAMSHVVAMKQALEALEEVQGHMNTSDWFNERADALRTAIEAAEKQEPVAWGFFFEDGEASNELFDTRESAEKWLTSEDCLWAGSIHPLYTTPPGGRQSEDCLTTAQRQWTGLTDEEIAELRRLHEENERLAGEVANRNRRALDGDEAVAALSNVHAYYEKLERVNAQLVAALNAMLTHMGMDEDEWNKPTFDKARAAIAAATGGAS